MNRQNWLVVWTSLLLLGNFSNSAMSAESKWVRTGSTGRLIYVPDAEGDRILDFSNVGYKGRGVELLPNDVPTAVTVLPIVGDDTVNIQTAINAVAALPLQPNGYRGAVLIESGHYDINTQLNINTSGVVIRGASREVDGTVLHARGTTQRSLIQITGTGSQSLTGPSYSMVDKVVPAGSTSFRLNSTAGLAVGQTVRVERPGTQRWIDAVGMDDPPGSDPAWLPNEFNLRSDRILTRIEGDRVFVDAPLATSFDSQFGGGTLQRYNWPSRIQNVGVENIRAESDYNPAEVSGSDLIDEDHAWTFVTTDKSQNVWVRNSLAKHFGFAAAQAQDESKWFTVDNVINEEPVSIVTGSRRYSFDLDGQLGFVTNSQSNKGRHDFVNNGAAATAGPNVFHNSVATNARDDSGPHRRWSTGTLFDNITVQGDRINVRNRGDYGTSHGWAGANMVMWNTTAGGYFVQNPPTSQNWLIGAIGPIQNDTAFGPQPPGNYDSPGAKVTVGGELSLYDAQFNDSANLRVFHAARGGNWNDPATWDQEIVPGVYKVSSRDYLVGDIDSYIFDGVGSVDRPYIDSAWQAAIASESTQPITGLDDVTGRHNVAFTVQHQLDAGERVIHGYLALAMRRANRGETGSDFVQLFDMDPAHRLAFSDLGWSASVLPSGSFVGVVDMGEFLDQMQNGAVNVRVNDDTGVDWAMYVATVATPLVGAGKASVIVDGGGSVIVDTAIAPISRLQVGGSAGGTLDLQGAASFTVESEYRQFQDGNLRIELSETVVSGAILSVEGQAFLDGVLEIQLAESYAPSPNDTFALLSVSGAIQGQFDEIVLPALAPSLGWGLQLENNTLLLTVVSLAIAGDFNQDGSVDAADYTVWRDSLGQTSEGLAADGSGPTFGVPDGVVDEFDYALWISNFGAHAGNGGASARVPEPTTTALLLLALFAKTLRGNGR
jgi:hypothetical protein